MPAASPDDPREWLVTLLAIPLLTAIAGFLLWRERRQQARVTMTTMHMKMALWPALLALAAALAVPASAAPASGPGGEARAAARASTGSSPPGCPGRCFRPRERPNDPPHRAARHLRPRRKMRAGAASASAASPSRSSPPSSCSSSPSTGSRSRTRSSAGCPGSSRTGNRSPSPAPQPHERTVRLRRRPNFLADAFRDPLRMDAARDRRDRDRAQAPLCPGRGLVVLGHQLLRPRADRRSRDRALPGERASPPDPAPLHLRPRASPTGPRSPAATRTATSFIRSRTSALGAPRLLWAAGALVSNADDLARFYRALLGGGLLRPDLLRAMETVVTPAPGFSYGLGLQKLRERCGAVWGHTGGSPGYVANALNSKDGSRQIVVLVNAHRRLAVGSRERLPVLPPPKRAADAVDHLIQTATAASGAPSTLLAAHARAAGRLRCRPANSRLGRGASLLRQPPAQPVSRKVIVPVGWGLRQ